MSASGSGSVSCAGDVSLSAFPEQLPLLIAVVTGKSWEEQRRVLMQTHHRGTSGDGVEILVMEEKAFLLTQRRSLN